MVLLFNVLDGGTFHNRQVITPRQGTSELQTTIAIDRISMCSSWLQDARRRGVFKVLHNSNVNRSGSFSFAKYQSENPN